MARLGVGVNTMQQMIEMKRQGVPVAEIARWIGLRSEDVRFLLGDTPNEQQPKLLATKFSHNGVRWKKFDNQKPSDATSPKVINPNKRERTICGCGKTFLSKSRFNKKCPTCTRSSPERVSKMVEWFRTKAKNPSIGRTK